MTYLSHFTASPGSRHSSVAAEAEFDHNIVPAETPRRT
jgi:hypothetical protein